MELLDNDPCNKIKSWIENGGSTPNRMDPRGPKGLILVYSYFRVVFVLFDFDPVFFFRFPIKVFFSSIPTDLM